ncbi:hypothetical protein B0T17DRAFT_549951 [Bombardia bombarda]|uniref:F-box domain-containing protein n=1 Tax=Bombardia bombarda TaxID=252184 RepID=A0AA39XKC5_9PEZI|nr:hypothetical protein B0T17DRAFT_549951 [Bombardia bombarda]
MPGYGSPGSSGNQPVLGNGFGGGGDDYYHSHSRSDGYRPFGSSLPAHGSQQQQPGSHQFRPMATRSSAMALAKFPDTVLRRIFAFVCPHTCDESYETCEQSSIEDACMLCDLRDLAHCVAVNRRWRKEGVKQLYHSIRIDSVHYCEREAYLSDRRKRRSFFDRNGEPEDTTQVRLKLLARTLRDDPVRLGAMVHFLKTPYMLRESCQADLARTINVTPNLRYVDLPEGLFTDDPAFHTLRLEVQARCLELRKMTYMSGSEGSLQALASGTIWRKLEVLELIRINMDPAILRQVIGCLENLRALKISDTECVTDEMLAWNDMMPPIPPLEELVLTGVPNVTAEGLKGWLVDPGARQALKIMTFNGTGVRIWALQEVVIHLPVLKHLSIIDSVTAAMPTAAGSHSTPPFSSPSLETLHYEITVAPTTPKYLDVTSSYYHYLAGSLLSGGLPNLRALYVRDPNFPELVLGLPLPTPSFAGGSIARPASSGSNYSSPQFSPKSSSSPHALLSPTGSPPFASPPRNPFANISSSPSTYGHRPQQSSISSLNSAWKPGHTPQQFSSNNPFASLAGAGAGSTANITNLPAKLEVFTKSDDELDWSFVKVSPDMRSARDGGSVASSSSRPLSSYGLGADVMGGSTAGWSSGAGARRSVLVGGAGVGGGFLAVPSEGSGSRGMRVGSGGSGGRLGDRVGSGGDGGGGEDLWPRPVSSAGERKRERLDLWR